jgi:hypothetical protein
MQLDKSDPAILGLSSGMTALHPQWHNYLLNRRDLVIS